VPIPLMCVRVVPVLSRVKCLCPAPPPPPPSPTDGFTSEGEILEISDIQRGQAGEYECVTHNGVNSAPDSRRVLVTVNCERPWHWAGRRVDLVCGGGESVQWRNQLGRTPVWGGALGAAPSSPHGTRRIC
jgi:hypothetical protein